MGDDLSFFFISNDSHADGELMEWDLFAIEDELDGDAEHANFDPLDDASAEIFEIVIFLIENFEQGAEHEEEPWHFLADEAFGLNEVYEIQIDITAAEFYMHEGVPKKARCREPVVA